MMFKNKLATDKPIEIFIALFVILVVAMVILKMFQSQIAEKQEQLKKETEKQRLEQLEKDLNIFCSEMCSKASRSKVDQVEYCLAYYQEPGRTDNQGTDLNGDGLYNDYIDSLSRIKGFCEDRIYCSAYYNNCGTLTTDRCKSIVCSFLEEEEGFTADVDQSKKLLGWDENEWKYINGLFDPGQCYYNLNKKQLEMHWFTKLLDSRDVGFDENDKCYIKEGICIPKTNKAQLLAVFDPWEDWCVSFDAFADEFAVEIEG